MDASVVSGHEASSVLIQGQAESPAVMEVLATPTAHDRKDRGCALRGPAAACLSWELFPMTLNQSGASRGAWHTGSTQCASAAVTKFSHSPPSCPPHLQPGAPSLPVAEVLLLSTMCRPSGKPFPCAPTAPVTISDGVVF